MCSFSAATKHVTCHVVRLRGTKIAHTVDFLATWNTTCNSRFLIAFALKAALTCISLKQWIKHNELTAMFCALAVFVGESVCARVQVKAVRKSIVQCTYECKAGPDKVVMSGEVKLFIRSYNNVATEWSKWLNDEMNLESHWLCSRLFLGTCALNC